MDKMMHHRPFQIVQIRQEALRYLKSIKYNYSVINLHVLVIYSTVDDKPYDNNENGDGDDTDNGTSCGCRTDDQ